MNDKARSRGMGQRIAPPRFVLFVLVLIAGAVIATPLLGRGRGMLIAFDAASALFLLSLAPLLGSETEQVRHAARANDANRAGLLAITGTVMLVILVAVRNELAGKTNMFAIVLVIATLVLAWLFSNMVYALHYAHLFYDDAEDGNDSGGLDFPDTEEPTYWDFIYFSFTLGMTFQTSDVSIKTARLRRVVIGQSLAAFVFNLGVLAFTINVLGGGN